MKRALLGLLLVLSGVTACAVPVKVVNLPAPEPGKVTKFGAASPNMWATGLTTPVGAGNNNSVNVWDATAAGTVSGRFYWVHRIGVSIRCDQPVTLLYQTLNDTSTTWRTRNGFTGTAPSGDCTGVSPGSGAGHTVAASTDTFCDFVTMGPESRIRITNGATQPTTCEIGVALFNERELGM